MGGGGPSESLSVKLPFVWAWVMFPAISLSQLNYSYGCFVVGVVVVVEL